jgi:pyruvate dehydrogenase E2 component (dihydrolipoamide acetyltransferase)
MATKVFMEALSPTMEEGKVLTWHKAEGDTVAEGDILAEVETDKAVMELQARGTGVLRKILAQEGATVEVGSLVAVIAAQDEEIEEGGEKRQESQDDGGIVAARQDDGGRAAERQETATEPAGTPAATSAPSVPTAGRTKSSPLARRLAAERGIDLARVQGTGPAGRIIRRDIEAAESVAAAPTPAPAVTGVSGAEFTDVPLSQIRKTIAKRLVQSLGPVPHFFLTTEVDMERAADTRAALNALEQGPRISYNDIIMKVVAIALRQHPACNAWWQDDHVRYFQRVHLGMAVAVEDGLITPVIRDAHLKSLRDIAQESKALAERARDRKLTPEEYTGATFSVSNLGMFIIDQFTAVINPPEAGIIAVGTIAEKPVAQNGEVVVRKRMRLTMSCDHRVIDGATGAAFLQSVNQMLENPLVMVW